MKTGLGIYKEIDGLVWELRQLRTRRSLMKFDTKPYIETTKKMKEISDRIDELGSREYEEPTKLAKDILNGVYGKFSKEELEGSKGE